MPEIDRVSLAGYNHYATFIDPMDGFTFTLHSNDYKGDPLTITLNSTESEKVNDAFVGYGGPSTSELECRDFCKKVTMCLQKAAESTKTGAVFIAKVTKRRCSSISGSIKNYFTANNYANLNTVLQGTVVGLVVNIVSAPITNVFLNSDHSLQGQKKSDACDLHDKRFLADDFVSAVGEFCVAIQKAQSTKTETHFIAGDVADSGSHTEKGERAMTKAFVAAQAGNFGHCVSRLL
ncbi:hypothetical protein ASPCAL03353 [Aspergillus calidoustus]|uniref:Uncharacterized protein n=1 Tax=Aspergillus calidoustus TaxID=454130 RepID=A0A0U4YYB3_ASPCI|nr:hypothetical protein ASPCAL03353 [Aspergillus calidoustus]